MSLSFKDDAARNSGPGTWQIDGNSVSFQSTDHPTDIAAKISDCIIDNTIKYVTSTSEGTSLGFFAFIWSALYFSVADTLRKRELEYAVLKNFMEKSLKIFDNVRNPEDTAKFLFTLHEAVLEELSKANISTDNKDGILRAHQMTLILANDVKLYDGSVIPSPSQENAFLLAATSVKRNVASILSPPSPPPVPVPRPQAAVQTPATKKNEAKKWRRITGIFISIAVISFILIVALAGNDPQQPETPSLPKPQSGTVLSGSSWGASSITIHTNSREDCVVSLKTASGTTILAFYVRAGDTITVSVPEGNYYVYFATGTKWYGYGQGLMFGSNTDYSKDDTPCNFTAYTWEYTLYETTSGNFTETPTDEDDFFN